MNNSADQFELQNYVKIDQIWRSELEYPWISIWRVFITTIHGVVSLTYLDMLTLTVSRIRTGISALLWKTLPVYQKGAILNIILGYSIGALIID